MYSPFFFYSLLRLKQKRRIAKSSRKPNTVREKNQWSFRWISGLVRTTRESSRGRCGGVFREQSTKKGGKKSEKKKNEKCKQDQRASPCSTLRCRDGPGSIPTTFLSPLDTIFALQNLHKR